MLVSFNHLLRRGAEVVTAADAPVHVSGHPSREELRRLIELLRPRHLVPIHGEYRQLLAHAKLGVECGLAERDVVLADSGDVLAIDEAGCRVTGRVDVGQVFIDAALDEVDPSTIQDRKRAAYEGTVVAVVAVDRADGSLRRPPELVARGLASEDDQAAILEDAARALRVGLARATAEERADEGALRARIHRDLKRHFRRRVQRRPMIIPVIVEY